MHRAWPASQHPSPEQAQLRAPPGGKGHAKPHPYLSRWIKFEEKVEEGGERWSKPHVSTLSLHSLFELRTCLQTGTVLLDLDGGSLPQIIGEARAAAAPANQGNVPLPLPRLLPTLGLSGMPTSDACLILWRPGFGSYATKAASQLLLDSDAYREGKISLWNAVQKWNERERASEHGWKHPLPWQPVSYQGKWIITQLQEISSRLMEWQRKGVACLTVPKTPCEFCFSTFSFTRSMLP